VIIIECTLYPWIKNKTKESAQEAGHIHWDSLKPIIKESPQNFFVLIHASQSVKTNELELFETETKEKENILNWKIWLG